MTDPASTAHAPRLLPGPCRADPSGGSSAGRGRDFRGRPRRTPLLAGLLYVVAWIAGLCAWPSNLAIDADAAAVAGTYRADDVQAFVQYLLVEGVAGMLLALVTVTAARRLAAGGSPAGDRRVAGVAVAAGLLAAVVSVTQWILGMALIAAAEAGATGRSDTLFDLVNRLDGGKMLLLAAAATCLVASNHRRLPRWLTVVSVLAAVSLAASGVGYVQLSEGAAWLVYVSGPVLLLWIPAVGFWASRLPRDRSAGQNSTDA